MDDDQGTSLILANTKKGLSIINGLNMKSIEVAYEEGFAWNPAIEKNPELTIYRDHFYQYVTHGMPIIDAINKTIEEKPKAPFIQQLRNIESAKLAERNAKLKTEDL